MNGGYHQKDMKYGQIAENRHINAFIYHCFKYIHEIDERKFVKKFREQPHNSEQIMHTFRELILGAYLGSNGFNVRYDYVIESKTPDWCILSDKSALMGIVELATFHIDKATEIEINRHLETKGFAGYWRDKRKNNIGRLYHLIWDKAVQYRSLGRKLEIPYVVAIFGDFLAAIDSQEVRNCLNGKDIGLFGIYPEMSGLLFFWDSSGGYFFNYLMNPNALKLIDVPNGIFFCDERLICRKISKKIISFMKSLYKVCKKLYKRIYRYFTNSIIN